MNIVFFDTESTGLDINQDRIVQIAALKLDSDWKAIEPLKKYLLNPGRPISPEATAVHGITDDMVRQAPSFAQIQKGLFSFLEGCAIAGFNILDFDVPLLAEEFARCERTWPLPGTLYADAYRIFREKEKRDLSAAMKFYLNEDHLDAHDAGADVLATERVLAAQVTKYPDLQLMNLEQLSKFCIGENAVDLAGKFTRNADGKVCFAIGASKGEVVNIHKEKHRTFLDWMIGPKASFPADTRRIAKTLLNGFQP